MSHYFEKDDKVEVELSTGELIRGRVIGYEKIGFDWPDVWVITDEFGHLPVGHPPVGIIRRFKVSGKQVTKIANLEDPPWEESKQAHAPGGVETI